MHGAETFLAIARNAPNRAAGSQYHKHHSTTSPERKPFLVLPVAELFSEGGGQVRQLLVDFLLDAVDFHGLPSGGGRAQTIKR